MAKKDAPTHLDCGGRFLSTFDPPDYWSTLAHCEKCGFETYVPTDFFPEYKERVERALRARAR